MFIGLLASSLLEGGLLRVREFVRHQLNIREIHLRKRPSLEVAQAHRDLFRLGPLQTYLMVIEGDGEQVINERNIHIVVESRHVQLPQEMQEWRAELLREHEARAVEAKRHFWNGENYAIMEFSVARTSISEGPEVFFRLQYSDYGVFLAAQQLDRPFRDGTTPRSRYLNPNERDLVNVPAFMSSSFGANVAMLTSDGYFIFSRRSMHVGSRPGVWSSSADEALSRTLDDRTPNLYDVMRRGIHEELGICREEYSLELLAITIDTELHQWGGHWVALLRELTGEEVLERRTRGVADKWEHSELRLVSSDPEMVLEFLIQESLNGNMAPHTPNLFYFALVRRYGRYAVELALKNVLRRRKLIQRLHHVNLTPWWRSYRLEMPIGLEHRIDTG